MQVNEGLEVIDTVDGGLNAAAAEYLVLALRQADAAMRTALQALRYACDEPNRTGLPIERLAGLAAGMTGTDVRFLTRAIEILDPMPATWLSFQRGQLSWSQLRGIILAARPLRVADRAWLDAHLVGAIDQGGEPDRIGDIATDLAAHRHDATRPNRDVAELDCNRLIMQPTLDGTRVTGWFDLDADGGATLAEATDLAAGPPASSDHPVDADSRAMPAAWGPCRRRSGQRAEGLVRLATSYLARGTGDGTPSTARPSCLVVLPAHHLTGPHDAADDAAQDDTAPDDTAADDTAADDTAADDAAVQADDPAPTGSSRPERSRMSDWRRTQPMSARLLWRLPGRGRITAITADRLACDAQLIPLAVNDEHTPIAAGDATTPITLRQRRAAAASDQGCRFPGCTTPIQWTDLHHVIHRNHGGPTVLANLVSLCRRCHTRVHQRGWNLTLHTDRTLHVQHGRWTATSRPPGQPPPPPPSVTAQQPTNAPTNPAANPASIHTPITPSRRGRDPAPARGDPTPLPF